MNEDVGFSDFVQELIAKSSAFPCSGHESCAIDEFRGNQSDSIHAKRVRRVVGYFEFLMDAGRTYVPDSSVRFYGRKRVVRYFCRRQGGCAEESGFASVWFSHYA